MRDLGENQRLEETRLFFQKAARDEFIGAVEEITGRKVRAVRQRHGSRRGRRHRGLLPRAVIG